MTEAAKPESISTVPETPAPAPATTTDTPPAAPAAAAMTAKPGESKFDRGGKGGPKRKPGAGGGGGMPNRRILQASDSLVDYSRFENTSARLNEIDAEIAGELDAALGSFNTQELMGADSSRQAREQAASSPDQGRKKGKVLSIHGADVFIDVPGGRSQGVMAYEQFTEGPPTPGMEVEFSIEGYDPANGLLLLSRKWAAMQADWSSLTEGMIVEARVVETNKGGLTVEINNIRGFLPISQIELFRVEDLNPFVNQKLTCIVTEVDRADKNLIVSRRALLEKQREEMREKVWAELEVGQVREGIVRNVKDFGAFVDLGGVDGFLHVSEMSWSRVQSATAFLQPGQKVKVAILKLDKETRKVSVGLKQLEVSPWDNIDDKYPVGEVSNGKVTRLADFGAFVELESGVEGLVHVSELAARKVWRVSDVVKEGDEVAVRVISVDPENRRISLSIRQAAPKVEPKPEADEVTAEAEPETPAKPDRPRNFELRGGLSGPAFVYEPKQ